MRHHNRLACAVLITFKGLRVLLLGLVGGLLATIAGYSIAEVGIWESLRQIAITVGIVIAVCVTYFGLAGGILTVWDWARRNC